MRLININNQSHMPNENRLKQIMRQIYNLFLNFLKKEEDIRKQSKEILNQAVKQSDEQKMKILKDKINKLS